MRSPIRLRPAVLAAVVSLIAALALPTHAAAVTVSGKLRGAKGYTLVALSPDGSAKSQRLRGSGRFKLSLRGRAARGATLALVGGDGSYRGPVVLRADGRRTYLALSGRRNANVGTVVLKRGYAIARRDVARAVLNMRQFARASRAGKPAGAGRLGLVRPTRGGAVAADHGEPGGPGDPGPGGEPGPGGPGGGIAGLPGEDTDEDGLVGSFDVDDDGDGVLDQSDPAGRTDPPIDIGASLPVDLEASLNANAANVTGDQIDALLRERLNLLITFHTDAVRGDVSMVDVDCLGVGWCPTAEVIDSTGNRSEGLWRELDANRNGLPDLPRDQRAPVFQVLLWPRADTSQIEPGDTVQHVATVDGGTVRGPVALSSYFTTVPAVKTWDRGAGPEEITYPVPPGSPGTREQSAQLSSEKLTLTFWRPQRPAIAGAEPGTFIDMGHLYYGVDMQDIRGCAPEDYSNLSPTLSLVPTSFDRDELFVLKDFADDAPADAANTLSFTVDLGACMRRAGIDPSGRHEVLTLRAGDDARNTTGQHLNVRMP